MHFYRVGQKQKLNTKSSTEGEIVGVSDFLPNMIWVSMFLEAQGFSLEENILYQDNESAMKIVLKGKRSCSAKTKHMNHRYFWIKDRLENEKIKVKHCKMVPEVFTKPLKGSLFRKFRDVILGYKHISSLYHSTEEDSSTKECVGGNNNVVNVRPSVDKHHPTVVTWADVVREKVNDT